VIIIFARYILFPIFYFQSMADDAHWRESVNTNECRYYEPVRSWNRPPIRLSIKSTD